MKKYLISLCIAVIVLAGVASATYADRNSAEQGLRRVLARSEGDATAAEKAGCRLARRAHALRAYVCSRNAADALGFPEDIRVFAHDVNANAQVKANMVHSAGNIGAGRKVAVIDTGYNYLHPELSSSYVGGIDLVNDDSDPFDDNGHGSHVAGIITADGVSANAKGAAPEAGVVAVKALDVNGTGFFSDIIAGIYWVVDGPDGIATTSDDWNADAINMSLGSGAPYLYKGFCDTVYPEMTSAIKYAKSRGTLVVVAAGNSGRTGVSLPGCIGDATTIGAVDSKNKIASFSGRGTAVDLVAPGVNLYAPVLGSGYATWSGTSMATPVASAVAALVRYAHPGWTSAQIESAMFSTAQDLGTAGKDKVFGWGLVNAWFSVQ